MSTRTQDLDHALVLSLIRLLLREQISGSATDALRIEFARVLKDRARREDAIAPRTLFENAHEGA
jgi:hypothetical protein